MIDTVFVWFALLLIILLALYMIAYPDCPHYRCHGLLAETVLENALENAATHVKPKCGCGKATCNSCKKH